MLRALALCRGINTFIRKCLCSSFSGSAKPLIILQRQKKVNRNIHKQVKEIMSAIGPDECQVKVIVKLSTGCLGHLPLFFKMKQNVTLLINVSLCLCTNVIRGGGGGDESPENSTSIMATIYGKYSQD